MIPHEQHLLPPNSVPIEQAAAATTTRLDSIDVPIADLWDPWKCPLSHLPWLADAVGVDIWQNEWPEERKRELVSRMLILKSKKGKPSGYREYVSYADGKIEHMVRPPSDFFWAGDDQNSLADWMQTLPQIRIYPYSVPGVGDGCYFSDFLDDDQEELPPFMTESTAHEERGRRAVLWIDGTETPISKLDELSLRSGVVEFEEYSVSTPVSEDVQFFDNGWSGDYLSEDDGSSLTVGLYQADAGSVLYSGQRLVSSDPEYSEQDETVGEAEEDALYAADGFMGDGFYIEDQAPYSSFERYYVYRPSQDPGDPDTSRAYYDRGMRYGIDRMTTELSVSLPETAAGGDFFLSADFISDAHYCEPELENYWFMIDAVATARAFRDRPLVDTEVLRTVRLTDRPKLGVRLGEKVRSF